MELYKASVMPLCQEERSARNWHDMDRKPCLKLVCQEERDAGVPKKSCQGHILFSGKSEPLLDHP